MKGWNDMNETERSPPHVAAVYDRRWNYGGKATSATDTDRRYHEGKTALLSWQNELVLFLLMLAATEIKRMSPAQRLHAMELLWSSLSTSPAQLKSPAWHGTVLARRLAKVDAGAGRFLTLPQIKVRLSKKRL